MFEYEKRVKRISVSIGGTTYHLVSDENDEYTREIARKADDAIKQILIQNSTLSNYQATVLALVNTTDALSRLSPAIAEAKNDVENANLRAKKAQDELFLVRDAEFELRKELLRINELNKQLELEIAVLRQQQGENMSADTLESFSDTGYETKTKNETEIETETENENENETDDADIYGEYKQSSLEEFFS